MIYFLILTAFTVSIDSFVCGFSLSLAGKKKYLIVIGITLTVFAMCVAANYATFFLANYVTEKTACLGGIILILVGVCNLLKKDKPEKNNGSVLRQAVFTGFAVGLDGAAANLSLALMGLNGFYVPLIIALTHLIMISLGIILSKVNFAKKISEYGFIPPLILILLGVYKVIGFFL